MFRNYEQIARGNTLKKKTLIKIGRLESIDYWRG